MTWSTRMHRVLLTLKSDGIIAAVVSVRAVEQQWIFPYGLVQVVSLNLNTKCQRYFDKIIIKNPPPSHTSGIVFASVFLYWGHNTHKPCCLLLQKCSCQLLPPSTKTTNMSELMVYIDLNKFKFFHCPPGTWSSALEEHYFVYGNITLRCSTYISEWEQTGSDTSFAVSWSE